MLCRLRCQLTSKVCEFIHEKRSKSAFGVTSSRGIRSRKAEREGDPKRSIKSGLASCISETLAQKLQASTMSMFAKTTSKVAQAEHFDLSKSAFMRPFDRLPFGVCFAHSYNPKSDINSRFGPSCAFLGFHVRSHFAERIFGACQFDFGNRRECLCASRHHHQGCGHYRWRSIRHVCCCTFAGRPERQHRRDRGSRPLGMNPIPSIRMPLISNISQHYRAVTSTLTLTL